MKNYKLLKLICLIIFIAFIFTYVINYSGYYEYTLYNKKNLTNEQIKIFEKNIKEGKTIDINSYLQNTNTDYSNTLTNATTKASIKLNEYLKKLLTNTIHILEKLVK